MKVAVARELRITRDKGKGRWWKREGDLVKIEERFPGGEWNLLGYVTPDSEWTVHHIADVIFTPGWKVVEL